MTDDERAEQMLADRVLHDSRHLWARLDRQRDEQDHATTATERGPV